MLRRLLEDRRSQVIAALIVAVLILAFWFIGQLTIPLHAATIDEPLHSAGSYLHVFERDFRVNPEDPPLWNYVAMLPAKAGELQRYPDRDLWDAVLRNVDYQSLYVERLLFEMPTNDGAEFVNRCRRMMLLVGATCAALIACFTWRVGGGLAAVIATALFCFDPNFLAHTTVMKNDIAITLLFLAAAATTYNVGRRISWWNVPLLGLICGAAVSTKFSGVLAGPIVAALLVLRAMNRDEWICFRRPIKRRLAKLAVAVAIGFSSLAISVLVIWASYGFRFEPTAEAGALLNLPRELKRLQVSAFAASHHREPADGEVDHLPMPSVGRAALYLEEKRLLPQAWIYGFVFTHGSTLTRGAAFFLLDRFSHTGWWYYFPLAMLFKTPLATLGAFAMTAVWFWKSVRDRWLCACLLIPVAIYGGAALSSNLNLGLRHILPIYPFLFIAVGLTLAAQIERLRTGMRLMTALLAIGLIVETLGAFPHYLSFFNAPSRPYRLLLLADANLDWGQDLIYLAEWQRKHPGEKLYLGYIGFIDPAYYGIHYINIPGGYQMKPNWTWPMQPPATVAFGASLLQGVNAPPRARDEYARYRNAKPREIVGDTIYIYDVIP